jgi:signal transduction histidine kinase
MADKAEILDSGTLSFTIESRLIRELGERLVKQPEVALLELVKNAYDADAELCTIEHNYPVSISVRDTGHGMTLDEFKNGWMRIGTSSKESSAFSRKYERVITGEKGIGRFAVRFLGTSLHLESVAFDPKRGYRTHLSAEFDWPAFDRNEDIGKVKVPYALRRATEAEREGTSLLIAELRPDAAVVDSDAIKTAALTVVTPYHALMRRRGPSAKRQASTKENIVDPGFTLKFLGEEPESSDEGDVAHEILENYVLRAVIETDGIRVKLQVFRRGVEDPAIEIDDRITNRVGSLYGDIRFFPQRKGTFRGLSVDGRRAKSWIKRHSGISVFDRTFRVHPYGTPGDDWLSLSADHAKSVREPSSSLAKKHLVMDEPTKRSTQLNYMLRLPYPEQLVGLVQVQALRTKQQRNEADGLIPAADREGFLQNAAFRQLQDLCRGAVEAIASADRELQVEEEKREEKRLLQQLRSETREAIKAIETNPHITRQVKLSLVRNLTNTQRAVEQTAEIARERETTLEVMSLLGVVAGFMTHEFGTAIDDLEKAQHKLERLAKKDSSLRQDAELLGTHITSLKDFVTYSQGYIQGTAQRPTKPFLVKPRIQQVIRVFGKYAADRRITLSVDVEPNLEAPLVPVSLYNGVTLNLYTNALKAVTAKSGSGKREIAFRSWNEQSSHFLEVSDTGVGIPAVLKARIFDPLFTTTSSNRDPLGSGMGLGLALVRRGAESFGGRVDVVEPPPGFTTCFRLKLPLSVE